MPIPADYEERVYAGVLGKLIGVYLGRPFEGWSHARILRELGPITGYVHERLGEPLVVTDDDIAGTFTFVRALEDNDYDPTLDSRRIGETWLNYIVENRSILWWGGFGNSTEETAWRRLRNGTPAPRSGAIASNGRTIAEQIGAQIFIDGWALASPGNPEQAARLAREAARVSHDGEAVFAAVLIAVMEAMAFVEPDMDRLIDAGLAAIPADCLIARLAADLRQWHAANTDWEKTRALVDERYGYHRYPGNCHVVPNHAVVLMALLYGGDDFDRAMMIANTAGWDTDCNAGNVGCLLGIRLGLAGIDGDGRGPDWRGPLADRLLLSSADGGGAVTDAVRVTAALTRAGRILAGVPCPPPPKQGARLHFSLPGSVQGFTPDMSPDSLPGTTLRHARHEDGARGLAIGFRGLRPGQAARAHTGVFLPPDIGRMRTYELMASPTLHPGQTVRARLSAGSANTQAVMTSLTLLVHGAGDALERLDGAPARLPPDGTGELVWTVPDLGGRPVATVGLAISIEDGEAAGAVHLDRLDWSGVPDVVLRRPDAPATFWRRAWVNAVTRVSETYPQAFRLSQDSGRGLLIYGAREWRDTRLECAVTVHLGSGGIAVRVQGLRRYYGLMLRPGNRIVLLKTRDGDERVLAEAELAWELEAPVPLALEVTGGTLRGEVAGRVLLQACDGDRPLADGSVALAVETGTLSTDRVRIRPASEAGASA